MEKRKLHVSLNLQTFQQNVIKIIIEIFTISTFTILNYLTRFVMFCLFMSKFEINNRALFLHESSIINVLHGSKHASEQPVFFLLNFSISVFQEYFYSFLFLFSLRPTTSLEKDSSTDAFLWILRNFYKKLFYGTSRVAPSDHLNVKDFFTSYSDSGKNLIPCSRVFIDIFENKFGQLNSFVPMYTFSVLWNLMVSGTRKRLHWERMG